MDRGRLPEPPLMRTPQTTRTRAATLVRSASNKDASAMHPQDTTPTPVVQRLANLAALAVGAVVGWLAGWHAMGLVIALIGGVR